MKTRKCFVANSSSSSFVCDTCDERFEGRDLSPSERDHCQCDYGHYFCREYLDGVEGYDDDEDEGGNYVRSEICPVCNFKVIATEDMKLFLYLKYKVEQSEVFAIIKEENKRRRKLYPHEYNSHVFAKFNTSAEVEAEDIRSRFKNVHELNEWKGE